MQTRPALASERHAWGRHAWERHPWEQHAWERHPWVGRTRRWATARPVGPEAVQSRSKGRCAFRSWSPCATHVHVAVCRPTCARFCTRALFRGRRLLSIYRHARTLGRPVLTQRVGTGGDSQAHRAARARTWGDREARVLMKVPLRFSSRRPVSREAR